MDWNPILDPNNGVIMNIILVERGVQVKPSSHYWSRGRDDWWGAAREGGGSGEGTRESGAHYRRLNPRA